MKVTDLINFLQKRIKIISLSIPIVGAIGVILEFLGYGHLERLSIVIIFTLLSLMVAIVVARLNNIKAGLTGTNRKISEIVANANKFYAFNEKTHNELIQRFESQEHTSRQIAQRIEKQGRATREEARMNSDLIMAEFAEHNSSLKGVIRDIKTTLTASSRHEAQLCTVEGQLLKLQVLIQEELSKKDQINSNISDLLGVNNSLNKQNNEILSVLERRLINKLRINPELTNTRVRVERMERRVIGLIERLRGELDDSFEAASASMSNEVIKIRDQIASIRDENSDSLKVLNESVKETVTYGNEVCEKLLKDQRTEQFDNWEGTVQELRSISEATDLNSRQLVTLLKDRSEALESAIRHIQGRIDSNIQELTTELEARVNIPATVELSDKSTHELAERYSKTNQDARRQLRRHVTETVRDSTRQMEALVKLAPRFATVDPLISPTGGYALDAQALLHLIDVLERVQPKVIVEFGGGTSTIWMAYICRKFGSKIISFDHMEEYLNQTRTEIARHGFEDMVELRLAPLVNMELNGEEYLWYSTSQMNDINNVDMLFVDGPPESTCANARRPAAYVMQDKLSDDAVIVLDDTHRKSEQETIDQWINSFPKYCVVDEKISRLTVMKAHGKKEDEGVL